MSGRVPWVSVSICSEPLPCCHRFANLKTLKTKAEVKMANFYQFFTHLKTAKRNIGVNMYYCSLSLPWKTNAKGKTCYCSPSFCSFKKNAKEEKMKKRMKLAIVYQQRAEILVRKCAIVYHQQRWKFKICNCLPSSLVWTSRRREITKVGGEGIFWESGITQQRNASSHNLTIKDNNIETCSRPYIHFWRAACGHVCLFDTQ